jgi:rhodanese-related sulfurtransferase
MKTRQLLFLITALASCSLKNKNISPIQDTEKVAHYFENELDATITPVSLKRAMDNKERYVIVDVCNEKDYKTGHIPGAINIPMKKGNKFKDQKKSFPGLIKDGINYVYCYALVCDLSSIAAKKFASLGYPVKELKGGFEAWKEHGFKIEKS